MAFDCRCFHDPAGAKDSSFHIGTNSFIVHKLLDHTRELYAALGAHAKALRTCKHSVLELLLFCKSGRHRSVALSLVMGRFLSEHPRVVGSVRVEHLSEPMWQAIHGLCGICAECRAFLDVGVGWLRAG